MRPILLAASFLAAAPAGAADSAAVKAKAAAVVKTGQQVLQTGGIPSGAAVKTGQQMLQNGQLPPGAAEFKSKAAAALGTMPADAAKALKGAGGQTSFTPEQLQQIQAQAGQAFSAVTSDPRAAAAAASAGVTAQKLDAVKAQTAAAVAGFKGADGKPSVEAAGQQARDFMKSEPVTNFKTQANEMVLKASSDPQLSQAARQAGKDVRAAAGEVSAQTGLALPGKRPALNAHNAEAFKTRAEQAVAAEGGGAAGAASAFETSAQKALVKFCKKYEGKTAVPARCRKPKPPVEE